MLFGSRLDSKLFFCMKNVHLYLINDKAMILVSNRQGADNFKHGIAILTGADYFSLDNRTNAYLNNALVILKFDE